MQAIDAHQHFWQYHPDKHSWISEDMALIRKDFLPADLEPLLEQNQVSGCIAVQADQTDSETDFLVALAQQHGFIKGVVGWVDLLAKNITEKLALYQSQNIIKGFRHILQGESPAFMLQPDFLRGIEQLQSFGFTYDILIYPQHLPAALQLVQQFPEQAFVIDHMAKPDIKNGLLEEWKTGMQALARYPNVQCKISGMVTEADWKNWKSKDLFPYLDVVTEAFGTNRLLYGSDWPVCLVAASYANMLSPVIEYYSRFTQTEQERIFAKNAIEFYHL